MVIYVAKTRAEDELILSSIGETPECVGDAINMNEYCRQIDLNDMEINILNPSHR